VAERPSKGIGWQLWDAAAELVSYLEAHPEIVQGSSVVELGSGCGLGGLAAAAAGARSVVLTDTEETVRHLSGNVSRNASAWEGCEVSCEVLDWTEEPPQMEGETGPTLWQGRPWGGRGPPEVVLVSDCSYWKHLFVPLHRTLLFLCGQGTRVVLAHKHRRPGVEAEAFRLLALVFVTHVAHHSADGSIQVLLMSLRPGLDLSRLRREALSEMRAESSDPEALLARLCDIEQDMESIAIS